ncbi:MAG: hypothetical protein K0U66_02640 [Gammaproteobacteria bacterium]|nr:hypothetical protein [Gammaproteobacteria bacterium]
MKFSTPVSSTPALCAAPVAFAVIPPVAVAGEYSHEPVTLPAEPGAWPVRVCHIKQNGEFLFEIPHCRSVRHEEEPSGHLLFIAKFPHYEANDTTGVYAFDKSSGTVTDSIFAVSYDGIVQDGDKTMVMVSYYKHGHDDDFMGSVNMPRTYELWNGKFTEIDPGPYADWTKLAVETAWLIGLDLTVSYAPSTLPPVAAINSVYHASSRQLREIFTYLDRYGLEESSDEGAAICTHSLAMTEAEVYLDALNRHGTAFYDGTLGRFAETDKFAHALRKHTDALYADTGLPWLYKQGRYHVMDGTDLLWSSPVQALAGPLGIVEAPAEQLLFLLGRPAPRPQPSDVTVWTYDRKKRIVTDTLSLAVVQHISYDDKTLVLTEGWNGAGYEAPYAPLHSRPHILSNGRWTEGSKEYTAQQNRYQASSIYGRRFISRLHLECRATFTAVATTRMLSGRSKKSRLAEICLATMKTE